MLSNAYSASLPVDRALRRIVLVSGLVFATGGVMLILSMPLPLPAKITALVPWLWLGGRDISRLRRAYSLYCGLRLLNDGELRLLDHSGEWHRARVLPGSILLRRLGWIRIADERGAVFAEPLRGNCRQSNEWRRLQVLWRHVGAHP